MPDRDSLLVQRLRAASTIVIGKTNVPEFGAGSHTFNEVFGVTRNPWALDRSAGGRSGGAGAALAAGLVPIADGSDYGGSIRNPASFKGVVGLRPSPGLVPDPDLRDVWGPGAVLGPMARTVGDLALVLSAISGPDSRCPLSHGDPAAFETEPSGAPRGLRIAWCPRLGGLPIERSVLQVLEAARARLEAMGAEIRDVELDLRRADAAFEVTRALSFARALGADLPRLRGVAKPSVIWNIERGLALDAVAIADATAARSEVFGSVARLLERFDVLAAPAAQVVPFPVDWEYPAEIDGEKMPHYLACMRVCSRITVSAHPVTAVPVGLTDEGLPVGLQLVGRYRDDRRLLDHAAGCEAALGFLPNHPELYRWADRGLLR